MKKYKKIIDGITTIKNSNQIIVIKDNMQTINPPEEMILADGWEEYVEPEPTEYEKLVVARRDKLFEIERYDQSFEVNEFFVNGVSMWLDKATRAGLLLRFQAEQASGLIDTTLWYNGISYPLKVNQAISMLYTLELYASECYDNTQKHLSAIKQLTTIEEIEAYDYTVGYPEKLNFYQ